MAFQFLAHPPSVPLYSSQQLRGFFILPHEIPAYAEHGFYYPGLVFLSYLIVVSSAYVALGIAGKLPRSTGRSQRIRLICGAFAMGAGIWSMHFIGMLAYQMQMLITYDPLVTALSMLVAILFAGAAFHVISGERLSRSTMIIAAPLLGLSVCGMHYIGMQAMVMDAKLLYRPDLFLLSFFIATTASAAALWIMFRARVSKFPVFYKIIAAMVMGVAVCGMHYTGMAASVFLPYADCRYVSDQHFFGLATSIALITFLIVSVAYLIKQLDEALAETQERTAQLFQAQKMEAVGQLTGGIAHDFNNILGVMLGNLELLSRLKPLPPRADMFINAAMESGLKARELTQRLLSFSRNQLLQPVPTDLTALVPSALKLVEGAIGPGIKIKSLIPEDLPVVRIDPVQLESALLNLALNAKDAMPSGGELMIQAKSLELTVKEARELEISPGRYVSVSMKDTGTGMTPEVIAHAMEPFFTTKSVGKGSGMGLSMVFGFARQSGGHVTLDSKPGHGTTVTIYLPVSSESLAPRQMNPEIVQGHETILIVDDEKELRLYMESILTELGYKAQSVASGEEALSIFKEKNNIDLLITDVLMPHMNGYQLAERAYKLRPELKILFISGYAQSEALPELPSKRHHFLAKPFTVQELSQAIQKTLRETG